MTIFPDTKSIINLQQLKQCGMSTGIDTERYDYMNCMVCELY